MNERELTIARGNPQSLWTMEGRLRGACGQGGFSISAREDLARALFVSVSTDDNERVFVELIEGLARKANLCYGFSFQWFEETDPFFFAMGISHVLDSAVNDPADDEDDLTDSDRWFNERSLNRGGGRYATAGFFRNVFPLNVLNSTHMNCVVAGLPFLVAVEKFGWGSVEELPNSNWLWTVAEQSSREDAARHLQMAGYLI
jgi:hypothetical protein